MAFVIADRVRETTTTTGTGTINLLGAVTNFETFAANLSPEGSPVKIKIFFILKE